MKISDMTLSQFLATQGLESGSELDSGTLISEFGHTNESVASTEALQFNIEPDQFSDNELPAFAASYLIRSGYRKVTAMKQEKLPEAEMSIVVGEDSEIGKVMIQVVKLGTTVHFIMTSCCSD